MKVRSKISRAVSVLLTLAMLLSICPMKIFAANPSGIRPEAIFKNMQLIGAVYHQPISTSYTSDVTKDPPDKAPRNYVYNSVGVNPNLDDPNPLDWMLLGFSIQLSQDVDLELYKLSDDAVWESSGAAPETILLPFRLAEDPENPDEALLPEDFLDGESLGFLKVYPYEHNYNGPDEEGYYTYDERFTPEDLFDHVLNVMLGDLSGATSLQEYRAVGFDGEPLVRDGEVVSLSAETIDEAVIEPEVSTDEPEAPVVTDAPGTEASTAPEATEPVAPAEDVDAAVPSESENDEESETILPVEDIEDSSENTSEAAEAPLTEELPTAPEDEEPETPEVPADDTEETPSMTQEPVDAESAPVDESTDNEPVPDEAPMDEPMVYADAPDMDGKIQNFSVWGGELVDAAGNDVTQRLEDGYYVIVLTPKDEINAKYNSFLCFHVDSSVPPVTMLWLEEYIEMMEVCSKDPVNMLNGSFSWKYTDFSLYGKYDLPFTRYYESADARRDHGLGLGWSTDYSVELQIDTLYARVTLPGGKDIYFDMFYDGTYRAKAGSAFTFEQFGSGYKLSHKDGTTYYFNADEQLTRISYLDGNYYDISYNGSQIASVTSHTGTLTFGSNGSHITSVSDGNGRTITLTYDGNYLASVTNADGDSLLYDYDANGYLSEITNFNDEVYVSNTYE